MSNQNFERLRKQIKQTLLDHVGRTDGQLKSEDYFVVQGYIRLCIGLPASGEDFDKRYPRADVRPYLTKDPTLYDGLRAQFPLNHSQCQNFLDKNLGQIETFGKDVMDYAIKSRGDTKQFGDLLNGLPSATSAEARGQSQQKLHASLDSFLNATEARIKDAGEVHVGLSMFESGTRSSSEELRNLQDRWNKNVSSEKVLNDEERKAVESASALQEAAKRALDEAQARANKVEDRKWIRWGLLFGGPIGGVILATDLLTGPTLDQLKTLADQAKRDYDAMMEGEKSRERTSTLVRGQLNNVYSDVQRATTSIIPAVQALAGIRAALSLIQTEFSKFKDRVQDIAGEENITAALVEKEFGKLDQLKDLDEAWGQEQSTARLVGPTTVVGSLGDEEFTLIRTASPMAQAVQLNIFKLDRLLSRRHQAERTLAGAV
ncbi:hypothetical protein MMC27_008421 [Xylographa pallens]|nr:hypothetical protein [Xylographa pallens]